MVKALRNILFYAEWTVDQVVLFINVFVPLLILLNAHVSFWKTGFNRGIFWFLSFQCVHFLEGLSYSKKPTHRFVLACTAFIRAYKINSGNILCRRTFLHIHTFQHMDIAFFGSVLFTSLRISLMIVPKNYLTLTHVYFSEPNYSSILLCPTYRKNHI